MMEGCSWNERETERERRCRNKKGIRICSRYIFSKAKKPSVCSGLGFVWIKRIVTPLMCTDNDGMEKHGRDWGVVFKVAEKMRDEGCRSRALPTVSPPPHPLLTLRKTHRTL